MKENIEIIENFLEECNKDLDVEISIKCDGLTRNAIEKMLSDYKRVLKENEELKEKWDKDTHKLQNDLDIANAKKIELQKENEKLERANKCYINSIQSIAPVLLQDYIEKQKIKDKIEELENYIEENSDEQGYWGTKNADEIYIKIDILQDLLEEKGE